MKGIMVVVFIRTNKQSEIDELTLFQNSFHFSILLFSFKLALVTSFLNSKLKRIFSLKRGNKGQFAVNKRILILWPFWNKVYTTIMIPCT